MKINTLFASAMAIFIAFGATAQDKKTIPSKLSEATVFFNGAELIHTAATSLTRGENEIYIEGLSPNIDMASLKVKATNSAVVSSFEYSIDYLASAKAASPAIKKLQDSLDYYNAEWDKCNTDIRINSSMIKFLDEGTSKKVSGSEDGMGVGDFIKTMDYYKSKIKELRTEQSVLSKRYSELNTNIKRLNNQLAAEQVKGSKQSGVLKLTLSAPMAGNTNFTVSYVTKAASWAPYYDINIASSDKPVIIASKAKVRQTTGLDWNRVKLTLSSAAPSRGKTVPELRTWFLKETPSMNVYYDEAVFDDDMGDAMFFGAESQESVKSRSASPKAPQLVIIDGAVSSMEELNKIPARSIKDRRSIGASKARELYGPAGDGGAIIVTLKSSMDDYVSSTDNALNMAYNINLPYSIPGNGKIQTIDLQTREASAQYRYYAVPKANSEVFLIAEIADWQRLGLLSGKANVTYDGTYVGETNINASSTGDKLRLTLGTDKRIAVKREKLQDYSSRKTLGNDVQHTLTYRITIKNNQNIAVRTVVKDQYPVSTQKNIVITLGKDTTEPTANDKDNGMVEWEDTLAPGEAKTYQLSYTIKHPKDMIVNIQ